MRGEVERMPWGRKRSRSLAVSSMTMRRVAGPGGRSTGAAVMRKSAAAWEMGRWCWPTRRVMRTEAE